MAGAKDMFDQMVNTFNNLGQAQKAIGIAAVLVVLTAIIFFSTKGGTTTEYGVLFSSLAPEDAADVVAKLQEQRIPYELIMDGTAIKVPTNKVLDTRLSLAGEGLPKGGGVGFEIFDRTNLGATDFVQKLNYQRAIQGELARTIAQFQQVQTARVHVATPKESVFIEDQKQVSASVSLKLRGRAQLNQHQIQAIVNLVSSAVPGLTDDNITVVDTSGRLLFKKQGGELGAATSTQLEYQLKIEKGLRNKVESMLEEIVGQGKALARISTELDFNQVSTTEELFDPEGQVVRSEQLLNEEQNKPGSQPQGIPGVKGDLATYAESGEGGASGKNSNVRNNITRNYEISKTTKHIKVGAGIIKRLSVAVMVDGTYKKVLDKDGKASLSYKPRDKEELKYLEKMVGNAVGYDQERGDRVEVVGMSFAASQNLEPEVDIVDKLQPFIDRLAMPLVYLIIAICSILFVVKPFLGLLTKRQFEIKRQSMMAEAEQEAVREDQEEDALKPVGVSDRERIYKLAQSDPNRAADLVRRWLREEV